MLALDQLHFRVQALLYVESSVQSTITDSQERQLTPQRLGVPCNDVQPGITFPASCAS